MHYGKFPCGPVVRTPKFLLMGPRYYPWLGNENPTSHAIATAKSLQLCPTLCDPIPGILQP